jgi:hypothetical protein
MFKISIPDCIFTAYMKICNATSTISNEIILYFFDRNYFN